VRNLARMTMPQERFQAQFASDFCVQLGKTPHGRAKVQEAIDRCFPILPAFFGKSGSANNALYRRLGIKQRSNEEMRADDITRARELVEGELKLTLPEVAEAA
jgi:ring-1,2-phenylacetyl-CoA epoxidase subunit PaaA